MKYIVFLGDEFVLFPEFQDHSSMVGDRIPISAGFCRIYKNSNDKELNISCYGNSNSLKLESRGKEDEEIIKYSLKN